MTQQDRRLWESIRTAMAEATQELVHYAPVMEDDVLLVFGLTQAEFDLLYGEVNAKCHATTNDELRDRFHSRQRALEASCILRAMQSGPQKKY